MAAIVSPLVNPDPPPAPAPAAVPKPVDDEKVKREAAAAARRAFLSRRRNGRLGTIATSARGVLSPGNLTIARRSLLVE